MALFDNITEVKRHNSAVTGDLGLTNIQSFIDDAVNSHVIPKIGRAQYNALITGKGGFASDSIQMTMLLLIQKAVASFTIAYYSANGAVEISDAGIHVTKTEKRLPASDKKILALRRQNLTAGYAALEMAVIYAEGNKGTFTQYAASDERPINLSGYINTSVEFPQTIQIDAELYSRVRSIQLKVEEDLIDTILGTTVAETLRDHILNGGLLDPEKELLKKIRRALAPLTIAEAIPYQLVSLDPTGAYVFSDTVGGISGNVENRTPAELQRLQVTMNKLSMDGEKYKESLRLWMNDNIDSFTGYTASTAASMADINKNVDGNVYFM